MTMRQEYVYLAHTYRGPRPANRVKIEEYENGIIFGVPLFTTIHMEMMRMMQPSLTVARGVAAKEGAGRRTDVEHIHTGRLHAVKLDGKGLGHIEKIEFADPRGPMATVTITDPEAIDIITGGNRHRDLSVEYPGVHHNEECMKLPSNECCCRPNLALVPEVKAVVAEKLSPELVEALSGGTLSLPHRPGCSHSRTGRCICDYIGQWDEK